MTGNSVDLDYLTQSVSDMLDITFAETVVNILQGCHAKIQEAETGNTDSHRLSPTLTDSYCLRPFQSRWLLI